ncbi:hypothetical protein BDV23DRAFT_147896 [Aspergillus alliaceus]|uniref:Secreted protein n=1 Tax=Petromyces alliaceus TaxID=209559 RepID=A0A5N7CKS9_PETAA|nr:hypothetical protein BDV23DRAFT_147896 [Aspergillus alliaceus]
MSRLRRCAVVLQLAAALPVQVHCVALVRCGPCAHAPQRILQFQDLCFNTSPRLYPRPWRVLHARATVTRAKSKSGRSRCRYPVG